MNRIFTLQNSKDKKKYHPDQRDSFVKSGCRDGDLAEKETSVQKIVLRSMPHPRHHSVRDRQNDVSQNSHLVNHMHGISLLEVILGVALFAMMAVMLFPAINYLYLRQQSSLRQSESTLLAQEALEIGFNVVTNNWDTFDFGDTYYPSIAGDGTWVLLSGTETNQMYSRSVSFADVYRSGSDGPVVDSTEPGAVYDPDTKKIVVNMQWNDPKTRGTMQEYEIVDYILNPSLIGQVITIPPPEPYEWVDHGLVIRYTFDEDGDVVNDVSGVAPAMNAIISNREYDHITRTSVNYVDNNGQVKTLSGVMNRGQGTIRTQNPALSANKLYNQCTGNDELTVVAWIRSRGTSQGDYARIVHYTQNRNLRNFGLSQDHLGFNVRLRTTATDLNGDDNNGGTTYEFTPKGDVAYYADTSKLQMLTMTYEGIAEAGPERKAKLYLDTNLIGESYNGGTLDNWDPSYTLTMFNEADGGVGVGSINSNREWEGELYYVAIHCEAFSPDLVRRQYLAGPNNDMVIPSLPPLADNYIQTVASCSSGNTLPSDWKANNVGGAVGYTQMIGSSATMCGSGHGAGKYNQWDDQFHYVYKEFDSDAGSAYWITAKLDDFEPGNLPKSEAGLMVRNSNQVNSPYLAVMATLDKGVTQPFRRSTQILNTNNTTSRLDGTNPEDYPPQGGPIWLGIQKYPMDWSVGDVAGFVSYDGTNWQPGTKYWVNVTTGPNGQSGDKAYADDDTKYQIGLVVMSSNLGENEATRARFENVTINSGINPNFPAPKLPGTGSGGNAAIPTIPPGGGGGGGTLD